jgi:uncharacterized protein (DUF2236 family)
MTTVAEVQADTNAAGLFGPGSMVWTVSRELAVLVGGGWRALLLQVAHPKIAAAVAEHSRFRSDPVGRLLGTLRAIYGFSFADTQHARSIIEAIGHLHARVVGATPDGEPYSARDPHLLLWVYATLIDSSLLAYETFVRPLTCAEREQFYTELRRAGPLWGIPPADFPDSLVELRAWMAELIRSGEVHVSPQGRAAGRWILQPRLWWAPPVASLPLRLVTLWLLPPELRSGFGYSWGPRREALMRALARVSRASVPHLPRVVRDLPVARAADRRLSAAR